MLGQLNQVISRLLCTHQPTEQLLISDFLTIDNNAYALIQYQQNTITSKQFGNCYTELRPYELVVFYLSQ